MMRAVVCRALGDPQRTRVEHLPDPALPEDGVRVAVESAGVSFANLLVLAGSHQNTPALPFTPGTEAAGVVLECGRGVTRVRPGDRVAVGVRSGGYADQVVAPERTVYPIPAAVDFDAAVHFPTIYATAYAALKWRAAMQPGEVLLVHGAGGGSGLAAVEIGKRLGATVIATASTPDKLETARLHGADRVVEVRQGGFRDAVLAATGGRGADVVYDPVGGDIFDESLRAIAPDGRIVPMGFASGRIPSVPANIALVKNITVIGLYWGYYVGWGRVPPLPGTEARVRAAFDEMFSWCAEGLLRPVTSAAFPLEAYAEALAMLSSRRVVGRVVLHPRR